MHQRRMNSFKAVFSPTVYGWQNALELNCLQFEKEIEDEQLSKVAEAIHGKIYMGPFTRMAGTLHDADCLTRRYLHHPQGILQYLSYNTEVGAVLREVFLPQDGDVLTAKTRIQCQIMSLRESLYTSQRAVAFLSGKHKTMGADSPVRYLSDDISVLVLKLLIE